MCRVRPVLNARVKETYGALVVLGEERLWRRLLSAVRRLIRFLKRT
jgi:hypothetical protein